MKLQTIVVVACLIQGLAGLSLGYFLPKYLRFTTEQRIASCFEVGVEKPDPRIFGLALARAGLAPGEAAYVGDLYSVDVRGARAAGMGAVLLDPGGHWGARDCPMAPDPLAAVQLILAEG